MESSNYYETRLEMHENIHNVMIEMHDATDGPITRLVNRVAPLALAVSSGIYMLSDLMSGQYEPNYYITVPIFIVALYFTITVSLPAMFHTDREAAAAVLRMTVGGAKQMPGLMGAPHDRLRDDKVAAEHWEYFENNLVKPNPPRHRASELLFYVSSCTLISLLFSLVAVPGYEPHLLVMVISALAIPSFFIHSREHRRIRDRLEKESDMTAYHLAEFGLTYDGKHER